MTSVSNVILIFVEMLTVFMIVGEVHQNCEADHSQDLSNSIAIARMAPLQS